MTINNYNTSTTGVDIEINCYYSDNYHEFDSNLKHLKRYTRHDNTLMYIDEHNMPELSEHLEDYVTIKGKRADLKLFAEEILDAKFDIDRYVNKQEILEYIYNTLDDYYEFDNIFYLWGTDDCLESALCDYDLTFDTNLGYEIVRGNCQGDVVMVMFDKSEVIKSWGTMPSSEVLNEHLTNICYGTPIQCSVYIRQHADSEGETTYYDEYFDRYDTFDRAGFIEQILTDYRHEPEKDLNIIKQELERLMPEEPEYIL